MKKIAWALALAAMGLAQAAVAQNAAAPAPVTAQLTAPAAEPDAAIAQGAASTPATSNGDATAFSSIPFKPAQPDLQIGRPVGGKGIQPQVTQIGREAADFHNGPLMWLCVIISLFVLGLLGYTMVRYRRSANPTPSRNSHNTFIEVVWTLVPVLILVAIAIPSLRLLKHQYTPPKADVTVKVIGNQWYWTYQYPDNGGFEIVSNMLKEKADAKGNERYRTDADGPPMLAVDERIVIPAGKVVKFLVTSNDVIHAFAVPAFWVKMDANPGQINETWAKVDRPGVYFGQCSELCGARHGYMPIAVEVVPQAQYEAWIASKGGTMPGAKPAATPASAPATAATPTQTNEVAANATAN